MLVGLSYLSMFRITSFIGYGSLNTFKGCTDAIARSYGQMRNTV